MSKHHAISHYDKYLSLKPNVTIWLILLFLSRPYLVLALSLANKKNRTELIDLVYPDRLAMSLGAFAGVPAAFLVYAWIKRQPVASSFVKIIWAKGRMLLASSALLNASIILTPLLMGTARALHLGDWAQLAISLLIVVVVYKSSYIRDCFNDFPSNNSSSEK